MPWHIGQLWYSPYFPRIQAVYNTQSLEEGIENYQSKSLLKTETNVLQV